MSYSEQFKLFRESRGLSREGLASRAKCHRNTVNNVESGRPVKFETISQLMRAMDYGDGSPELKLLAVLWLEEVSGVRITVEEAQELKREVEKRRKSTPWLQRLNREVARRGLGEEEVELLSFAAKHRPILTALRAIQGLLTEKPSAPL